MSLAITSTAQSSIYQRIILGVFAGMDRGSLTLSLPNGAEIKFGNAGNESAMINVKHPDFFKRCVLFGDIGFGESYVDGNWDTDDIYKVIRWFILNIDQAPTLSGNKSRSTVINLLRFFNKTAHLARKNSLQGSKKNIAAHYDLSNEFFSLFLDETMTYSSGFFADKNFSLKEAQLAKYKRLCTEMALSADDHVLEIGCGWGYNAIYMASEYGCKVTSLTISEEQFNYTSKRIRELKLEKQVTVLLQDYRTMKGRFSKIVSIEMLEAVGAKYYRAYFKKCNELLQVDGILALQVITCPDSRYEQLRNGIDWIQKHIFPGSLLPSVAEINKAVNESGELTLVDLKDLGRDYAETLKLWSANFQEKESEIKEIGFDDIFIRKWNYYFQYCQAAFASRNINVMQMIYTRPNNITR